MTTPSSNTYEVGSDYVLTRDTSEKDRLNIQHKYMTILLSENRLVYDRSVFLAPGSKVLDAGTGTGIWLEDLSKQIPATVELVGCDVSANNFPTHHACNMQFHVASVTGLPKQWSDRYDFVNQRFLFTGLRASEWPNAIAELYRVLKPGGHVQLIECDFANLVNPGPATKRSMGVCADVFAKAGLLLDASSQLECMLKETGFDEVKSEKGYWLIGRAWGRMGEIGKQDFLHAFRNLRPAFLKYGMIGAEKELESFVDACEKEWENSEEGYRIIAHIAIARKPYSRPKSRM